MSGLLDPELIVWRDLGKSRWRATLGRWEADIYRSGRRWEWIICCHGEIHDAGDDLTEEAARVSAEVTMRGMA